MDAKYAPTFHGRCVLPVVVDWVSLTPQACAKTVPTHHFCARHDIYLSDAITFQEHRQSSLFGTNASLATAAVFSAVLAHLAKPLPSIRPAVHRCLSLYAKPGQT